MYLFVYYKLDPKQCPALQSQISDMQALLIGQFPGVTCQLLKRPDTDEHGLETWMETYHLSEIDKNEFRQTLDRLTQDERFPGPRRNEIFISHS
jgi:Domain of unknown function (DUF4936)